MEEQIRKLYVEASSRCNLRCKMCFRLSWVGERFGDLDPEIFARVMDDPVLSAAETVFLAAWGSLWCTLPWQRWLRLRQRAGSRWSLSQTGLC